MREMLPYKRNRQTFAIFTLTFLITALTACTKSTPPQPAATSKTPAPLASTATPEEITARIRKEVADILSTNETAIDITKPLAHYGADELDVIEIVMAIEDATGIEIPDEALAEKVTEASKTLTAQKLATIIAEKKKSK